MSILDKIDGRYVRTAGVLVAAAASFKLSRGHALAYTACVLLASISWLWPRMWNWLSNFADPKFWPTFVSLGVAILIAAHNGGTAGLLACCGPLAIYDGMYFDQNY